MQKLSIWLAVALLTFVIGISLALLRMEYSLRSPSAMKPVSFEAWRKIRVSDQVSFYLPPYLEDDPYSSDHPVTAFRRITKSGLFYVHYYHDKHVPCDNRTPGYAYRDISSSDLEVDGKRARLITWIPYLGEGLSSKHVPGMALCFPDIGDGYDLYMGFYSTDKENLEVAKEAINSIEFRK